VQVLIVMDFLLSLSAKAKDKLAKSSPPENQNPNKSVMYADQVLSEDDVSNFYAFEISALIHSSEFITNLFRLNGLSTRKDPSLNT
jgi:hypothetical protein